MTEQAKPLTALWAILLMAFALRLAWALAVPVVPVSDSQAYLVLAQSLAAGKGYAWADGTLTAFWPPGTSFIYGALFSLFGPGFGSIVALHLVAGVALVYLGYRLAAALFDQRVAIWAAALLAAWPLLIQFTTILASEILFLVPVLAAMLLVIETRSPRWPHWLAFGALLAVATYIRPTATPLIVLLPLLQWLRDRSLKPLLGWILIGGLVCFLATWPWKARNTELFGQPTSLSTNFGANLWMGNNPQSRGAYQSLDAYAGISNEKQRDDRMKNDALQFIRDNPGEFLRLGAWRLIHTFDRETIGVVWNVGGIEQKFGPDSTVNKLLKLVSTAYWYAVLLAALAGLVLLARRDGWRVMSNPVFVVSGFFAAIPVIMVGQDRYHIPLIPMLACLAAYAVQRALPAKP